MAAKDDIFSKALSLPPDERAELAAKLLQSLDADEDVSEAEAEEAWDVEIERRVLELREGRVKAIPLEDVRREFLQRRAQRRSTRK
jgi:putative addiction module component (TIGR02574 family)